VDGLARPGSIYVQFIAHAAATRLCAAIIGKRDLSHSKIVAIKSKSDSIEIIITQQLLDKK
jgi:hypothetical protein